MIDLMKERLREARDDYGLTQRELGELIGVGKSVIMALENVTAMKAIHLEHLVAVAETLDVSIDWLFGRTNRAGMVEVPKIVEKPVVRKYFNHKWNENGDSFVRISENETW